MTDDLAAADDLLQLMFWLRGERLAGVADLPTLERLSGLDAETLARAVARLLQQQYIERIDRIEGMGHRLTNAGVREGGRRFSDEFADLTKPGHGECGDPECDCRRTCGLPRQLAWRCESEHERDHDRARCRQTRGQRADDWRHDDEIGGRHGVPPRLARPYRYPHRSPQRDRMRDVSNRWRDRGTCG